MREGGGNVAANTEIRIPFGSFLTASIPAVVMVSGGGDSVALLRLLIEAGYGDSLTVLHVNHGLRGAESDADESFVRDLSAELGVPCHIESVDVASYAAETGANVEDAGRRIRYAAAEALLDERCAETGTDARRGRIVTAHTRDDRVETFLARIASGAGAAGLASIPRRRGRIVRPLLDIARADLRAYLENGGYAWREDATNADTTRERAFIRHEIVGRFEQLNPKFQEALARTMDLLADDDALLQTLADGFARDFSDDSSAEEFVTLNLSFMRTLDPTMARRVVRTALLSTFADASRLESSHVQRLADALSEDRFSLDLPGSLRAEIIGRALRIERVERNERGGVVADEPPRCASRSLDFDGTFDLGGGGVLRTALHDVGGEPLAWLEAQVAQAGSTGRSDAANGRKMARTAYIDAELLMGSLAVGAVREGERFAPLGLGGSKKISDILVDAKVPREERAAIPVIRDGRNVVWVAGFAVAEDYRVTDLTSQVLELVWDPAREWRGQ